MICGLGKRTRIFFHGSDVIYRRPARPSGLPVGGGGESGTGARDLFICSLVGSHHCAISGFRFRMPVAVGFGDIKGSGVGRHIGRCLRGGRSTRMVKVSHKRQRLLCLMIVSECNGVGRRYSLGRVIGRRTNGECAAGCRSLLRHERSRHGRTHLD